jgi:hypothetical protein
VAGVNGRGAGVPKRFSESFDPDAVRVMMAAFDKACEALGLVDRNDPIITETVAKTIVEQARTGERDPDKLCALTLRALQPDDSAA